MEVPRVHPLNSRLAARTEPATKNPIIIAEQSAAAMLGCNKPIFHSARAIERPRVYKSLSLASTCTFALVLFSVHTHTYSASRRAYYTHSHIYTYAFNNARRSIYAYVYVYIYNNANVIRLSVKDTGVKIKIKCCLRCGYNSWKCAPWYQHRVPVYVCMHKPRYWHWNISRELHTSPRKLMRLGLIFVFLTFH